MRLCFLVFMSIFLDFPIICSVNLNPCSKVHINRLDVNLLITIQQRYHYESPNTIFQICKRYNRCSILSFLITYSYGNMILLHNCTCQYGVLAREHHFRERTTSVVYWLVCSSRVRSECGFESQ